MTLSRRDLVLGALAGAAAGCTQPQPAAPAAPAPAAGGAKPAATADESFKLRIRIQGGYALVFEKGEAALGTIEPSVGCFHPHPMLLQAVVGDVESSALKQDPSGYYELPEGLALFTAGVPVARKVKKDKASTTTPSSSDWDDFYHVPSLGKPHKDWRKRINRRVMLPGGPAGSEGTFHVEEPVSASAKNGEWRFQGTSRRLSDIIRLDVDGSGKKLALAVVTSEEEDPLLHVVTPRVVGGVATIELRIVHAATLIPWKFRKEDRLPHFEMYYYAAEKLGHTDCRRREVPIYNSGSR